MRSRLLDALDDATYRDLLVYVTGPYERSDGDAVPKPDLAWIRDELRTRGFNAFLPTDVDVHADEQEPLDLHIAFAQASNAVIFVFPQGNVSDGAGVELGAVLEEVSKEARHRVLVLVEEGVSPDTLRSTGDRWDAAVRTYADDEELLRGARFFLRDVIHRERTGELPPPAE